MTQFLSLLVAAAMAAAPASPATPAVPWRIVDLGTLTGECCSYAAGINDRGDIVGGSTVGFASHAFRWRDGRMSDLGTLGGPNSSASAINNRGYVAGAADLPDGSTHAALWRDGPPIDLGTLGGPFSYATAINDRGEVVGFSMTASGEPHAFVWRDGTMTDLGGMARAHGINNRGDIVGDRAAVPVRWRGSAVTELSTRFGQGTAINNRGQVAGYIFGGGAFLWSGGRTVDLGLLPDATFAQVGDLNDRGQVVGYSDFDAFVWQSGRLTALPRLAGGSTVARGIDVRGRIVGEASTNATGTNPHAVLWTR